LALNPGDLIGDRYQVIRELGGGGMKLVFLVEDRRLNRKAALAEMIDSFSRPSDQAAAVASFQREADMLAKLESEYIPRIFDRLSEHNRHYLVMEYVPGRTLQERMTSAGGKLDDKFVMDVAAQIVEGLEYLHGLKPPVIYRDLKPSNVIVKADGRIKMVDFGIARHFQPSSTVTMIGTQGYAPPEQYLGKVEVRSDLYALGATMHHLLTGRDPANAPPFSFPPTRDLRPDINPLLAELIDEALAYDVKGRAPNAQEFKRRLDRIRGKSQGLPTAARVASPPPAEAATVVIQPRRTPEGVIDLPPENLVETTPREMPCRNCERLIPSDATACPYCRTLLQEKPRSRTPWLIAGIVGIAAFAVLGFDAVLMLKPGAVNNLSAVAHRWLRSGQDVSRTQAPPAIESPPVLAAASPQPAPIPSPIPMSVDQAQQAVLDKFRGCWFSSDTQEIVESRTATGALSLAGYRFVSGQMGFCWVASDDGAVNFRPPSDGYAKLRKVDRQIGEISQWAHWTMIGVDTMTHQVKLRSQTREKYRGNIEIEMEDEYTCTPEGPDIECTNMRTTNRDHQPFYKEVDHFHMERTDSNQE
jgi:serine/threonine protein kinase